MIYPNHHITRFPGFLLSILPALSYGCSPDVLPEDEDHNWHSSKSLTIFTCSSVPSQGSTLDILTFEDDELKRLDSYKKDVYTGNETAAAESTSGEKIFFLCLNGQRSLYDWTDIQSYNSLYKIRCDIESEDISRLTMTGECRAKAGSGPNKITLTPLASTVVLKSINCDFSGTPYSGSNIENVKVYLTNVNATCPLLAGKSQTAERIINAGMLNPSDTTKFQNPGIICQELGEVIGKSILKPDIRLLCYPNYSMEDTPGTPRTRLVIEGEVDSARYYWPITINSEGYGIERNCCYCYDIQIRRKGTSDPEIPIEPKDMDIKISICEWKEMKGYGVRF